MAETDYEFPAFICAEPPNDIWIGNRPPEFIYGGLRVKPARGMEQTMQSIFPRIQVAMRRSMQDFQVENGWGNGRQFLIIIEGPNGRRFDPMEKMLKNAIWQNGGPRSINW